MLLKSVTKTTTKSASDIYAMYTDVNNWKNWDKSVETAQLDGKFVVGATGTMKPVGGPKSKIVISGATTNEYAASTCNLVACHILFEQRIKDLGDTREVTHRVSLEGFLAPVFKLILGKDLVKDIESGVDNVCK
jgi:ribosomal protein L30E